MCSSLTIDEADDTISPRSGRFQTPQIISPTRVGDAEARPHRLAAQDEALSRLKQRFESAWGHFAYRLRIQGGFYFIKLEVSWHKKVLSVF